jgi:hypothetical protein
LLHLPFAFAAANHTPASGQESAHRDREMVQPAPETTEHPQQVAVLALQEVAGAFLHQADNGSAILASPLSD